MEEFYDFGYGRALMKVLLLVQLASFLLGLTAYASNDDLVEGALGVSINEKVESADEKGCDLPFPWPSSFSLRSCLPPVEAPTQNVGSTAPPAPNSANKFNPAPLRPTEPIKVESFVISPPVRAESFAEKRR